MTPEQYKAAAQAITDLRWILAASLTATGIRQTKESDKRMIDLDQLRKALEDEGMKS